MRRHVGIAFLLYVATALSGCVVADYRRSDGSRVVYVRVLDQEISGFEAVGSDGGYVKFDAQQSDASALTESAFRGLGAGLRGGPRGAE